MLEACSSELSFSNARHGREIFDRELTLAAHQFSNCPLYLSDAWQTNQPTFQRRDRRTNSRAAADEPDQVICRGTANRLNRDLPIIECLDVAVQASAHHTRMEPDTQQRSASRERHDMRPGHDAHHLRLD